MSKRARHRQCHARLCQFLGGFKWLIYSQKPSFGGGKTHVHAPCFFLFLRSAMRGPEQHAHRMMGPGSKRNLETKAPVVISHRTTAASQAKWRSRGYVSSETSHHRVAAASINPAPRKAPGLLMTTSTGYFHSMYLVQPKTDSTD